MRSAHVQTRNTVLTLLLSSCAILIHLPKSSQTALYLQSRLLHVPIRILPHIQRITDKSTCDSEANVASSAQKKM
ncbi:hypothetical protein DFH11DRAFT_1562748 [Phellopilus nigrolimitatus]|nr:hypothetical protein DFH11DRAFT_1562748 [Phellopilus nigrolimitatus]